MATTDSNADANTYLEAITSHSTSVTSSQQAADQVRSLLDRLNHDIPTLDIDSFARLVADILMERTGVGTFNIEISAIACLLESCELYLTFMLGSKCSLRSSRRERSSNSQRCLCLQLQSDTVSKTKKTFHQESTPS
jgi:hypothetical protein